MGIDTAIFSQTGGSIGIGFAIPIDLAKPVLAQLAASGRVTRGWLGVAIQPLTADLARSFGLPDTSGALIASVVDGSPAMKAGLAPGDGVVSSNGQPVVRPEGLPRAVADTPVGRETPVTVVRLGKTLTLTATIAPLPEPEQPLAATESPAKPSLGMAVESITPRLAQELDLKDSRGVLVRDVKEDSPAANAGLRPGDVIVEVDHHAVGDAAEMKQVLDEHHRGTPVLLLVHRQDGRLYVAVTT